MLEKLGKVIVDTLIKLWKSRDNEIDEKYQPVITIILLLIGTSAIIISLALMPRFISGLLAS